MTRREVGTVTSRYGSVSVALDVVPTGHRLMLRLAYVVTTPTGYRATLPACQRDLCEDGRKTPCAVPTDEKGEHSIGGKRLVAAWRAHSVWHCHNWHDGTAMAFADRVLKSYAPAARKASGAAVGVARGLVSERSFMPLPVAS